MYGGFVRPASCSKGPGLDRRPTEGPATSSDRDATLDTACHCYLANEAQMLASARRHLRLRRARARGSRGRLARRAAEDPRPALAPGGAWSPSRVTPSRTRTSGTDTPSSGFTSTTCARRPSGGALTPPTRSTHRSVGRTSGSRRRTTWRCSTGVGRSWQVGAHPHGARHDRARLHPAGDRRRRSASRSSASARSRSRASRCASASSPPAAPGGCRRSAAGSPPGSRCRPASPP